jgi:sirohydrochlorin cobaltochelatase
MTAGLPLLLVGHGTRSQPGVTAFRQFTDHVRARARGRVSTIDGGFIELSRPSVSEAVSRMTAPGALQEGAQQEGAQQEGAQQESAQQQNTQQRGAQREMVAQQEMVAVPLVLSSAGHGKGDIPASLARERLRHPGLRWRYGRPLGPHPVLQDILAARIDAALDGAGRAGTHVVLVGRGSTDPDANAEVAKVARLLWEGRGYAEVEFCFISLAAPSVPAALERARKLGAGRIVVAPYFLFPGVLPDRVASQARQFASQRESLDVRVAELIGGCDELADLVLFRYEEALRGDIRMNCDTCAYRIALPGFADKVGRPQAPHQHPDDLSHDHVQAADHVRSADHVYSHDHARAEG